MSTQEATSSPRILVCAYSQIGHSCLKLLLERKENVVGLFTHSDSCAESIWFESCSHLAKKYGVPVYEALDLKTVKELKPDILFSFYYRTMIYEEIIALPTIGAFNMHGSLLPNYRGRAPINWAIIQGETKSGATLHVMEKKPDAGDILDQEAFEITLLDTAGSATLKLEKACIKVLKQQLPLIRSGKFKRHLNDLSKGSYFSKRTPEDGRIFSSVTVKQAYDMIRALSPKENYPPATFIENEDVFELYEALPIFNEFSFDYQPGTIIKKDTTSLKIVLKS